MPFKIHEEVMCCGRKGRCPTVQIFDDGSAVISDDDAELGSVGVIKLTPEQVKRLRELIEKK